MLNSTCQLYWKSLWMLLFGLHIPESSTQATWGILGAAIKIMSILAGFFDSYDSFVSLFLPWDDHSFLHFLFHAGGPWVALSPLQAINTPPWTWIENGSKVAVLFLHSPPQATIANWNENVAFFVMSPPGFTTQGWLIFCPLHLGVSQLQESKTAEGKKGETLLAQILLKIGLKKTQHFCPWDAWLSYMAADQFLPPLGLLIHLEIIKPIVIATHSFSDS